VEAGCKYSCIALEPIALEPIALELVALEPVTLEPVALETSRSQLPFILVYIDVKRIKTFNMKLTQEAIKLKLKLKRGIRCFYIILSGCVSVADTLPVSGSTLCLSRSTVCCSRTLSVDSLRAMHIRLHSH